MSAIWTLAGLTIKEAMRRRLFIAGLLIALLVGGIAFIHFPHRHRHNELFATDAASELLQRSQYLAWMGCGVMKFFSSILAVTLAAGAITAEIDRGVLSIVVPKPMPRAAIYLGKWLGLLILLASCLVVWSALLAWAIWMQTHLFHPRMFLGVLAVGLFPLLFTTLTLFFSSFATYALSAGLSLIAAGVAQSKDTLLLFSQIFHSDTFVTLSKDVSYIVPLSRMNHWITIGLGDAGFDLSVFTSRGVIPTGATAGADMTYIVGYILVFLAAGLFVFQRRDL